MTDLYDHLYLFLDRVHVGCSSEGFIFTIEAPAGRFPVFARRDEDGNIGRATIIFDAANVEESFAEELLEPLRDIWIESDAIIVAGDAARILYERDPQPIEGTSLVLDETGANVVRLPLKHAGTTAEVIWWYGGDDEAYHQGICALDIVWDADFDPVSPENPTRNMPELIQQFFDEHGPPSLQSGSDEERS